MFSTSRLFILNSNLNNEFICKKVYDDLLSEQHFFDDCLLTKKCFCRKVKLKTHHLGKRLEVKLSWKLLRMVYKVLRSSPAFLTTQFLSMEKHPHGKYHHIQELAINHAQWKIMCTVKT